MDLSDLPTTGKISWKPVAIIVAAIVLAFLIVFFIVRLIASRDADQGVPSTPLSIEQVQQRLASGVPIKEGLEICKVFEGEEYDGCVWGVASEQKDPQACESMINEDYRQRCVDGVVYDLVVAGAGKELCDTIKNQQKKTACQVYRTVPLTASRCRQEELEEAVCHRLEVSQQAAASQDAERCLVLPVEDQLFCQDSVFADDPDFDGLDRELERTYGTDHRNADTDGDGYNDGDEVAAGYSPIGSGKIE